MGPLEVCFSLSAIAVAVCRVPFRCLCPSELNSQMSNSKAREPEREDCPAAVAIPLSSLFMCG